MTYEEARDKSIDLRIKIQQFANAEQFKLILEYAEWSYIMGTRMSERLIRLRLGIAVTEDTK